MIDLYCERTGAGWWAEPWNLVSNGAFLLVAVAAIARARHPLARDEWTQAILVALIGLGSALFHGAPRPWTLWADVLPILAFQVYYLHCYLRRALARRTTPAVMALVGYLVALALGSARPALLNGSLAYLPAALVLTALACCHGRVVPASCSPSLPASSSLLVLRTIDPLVCPSWPRGTHWAWHLLNALVLGLALLAYPCERAHRTGNGAVRVAIRPTGSR